MTKREAGTFSYNAIRGPACGAPGSGSRSTAQSTLTYLIAAHHGGPKRMLLSSAMMPSPGFRAQRPCVADNSTSEGWQQKLGAATAANS